MNCILTATSGSPFLDASNVDPHLLANVGLYYVHPYYRAAHYLEMAISESLQGSLNVNLSTPIDLTASLQATYENPRRLQAELCYWSSSFQNYSPFG